MITNTFETILLRTKHDHKIMIQHTHEFTQGINMAITKRPRRGPPTIPKMLRAICKIKGPIFSDKKASPIVRNPYVRAINFEYSVARFSLM